MRKTSFLYLFSAWLIIALNFHYCGTPQVIWAWGAPTRFPICPPPHQKLLCTLCPLICFWPPTQVGAGPMKIYTSMESFCQKIVREHFLPRFLCSNPGDVFEEDLKSGESSRPLFVHISIDKTNRLPWTAILIKYGSPCVFYHPQKTECPRRIWFSTHGPFLVNSENFLEFRRASKNIFFHFSTQNHTHHTRKWTIKTNDEKSLIYSLSEASET